MIPGEIITAAGDIELNAGRETVTLEVANTGDRPIQVGSHYHFFETNPALRFDRAKARGFRLDIPAGTAVRFEPGQTREVALVAIAGERDGLRLPAADHGETHMMRAQHSIRQLPVRRRHASRPTSTSASTVTRNCSRCQRLGSVLAFAPRTSCVRAKRARRADRRTRSTSTS